MRFYLASWVGDGTEGNEYRPNVDAARWAAIDFRPDSTVPEGRVLVATDQPLATLPSGVDDLGDLLDEALKRPNVRGIEQRLGVTLVGQSLRQIIAELLIVHGESDLPGRTRWKRLKQTKAGRHRIAVLGETLYDAPAVVGAVITDTFDRADQTGLGTSSEGWSWSKVDADTSTIDIVSNQANFTLVVGGLAWYRADSDLDSDDHYAEIVYRGSSINTNRVGPMVRVASAAFTGYYGRYNRGATQSGGGLWKVVAGSHTQIATYTPTADLATDDVIRTEVDGSTIEVTRTGSVSDGTSTTDTDITGNLRAGLMLGAAGTNRSRGDSYEAGDLAAGPATGSASGAITWAGTANGTTTREGSATGAIAWAGTADGAATHEGSATGAVTWAGTADGETTHEGSATGAVSWSGTANGIAPSVSGAEGSAIGAIAWAGTADGQSAYEGSASGAVAWVGSADGVTPVAGIGEATGSVSWVGVASGSAPVIPSGRVRTEASGSFGAGREASRVLSAGLEGSN